MNKILLVEDEKDTADLIVNFLGKRGYEVDVAYDLDQGMEKFRGDYKIVLLDIMLEGQKSFPLLKKIKEENPQVGVIMVSAYDNDENIREAKALGADGFIAKPFVSDYLEQFLLYKIHSLEKKET